MNDYLKKYDAATQKVLEQAKKIDRVARDEICAEHSLYDIAYVLREKYKDPVFRNKYVGNLPFNGFIPYPKGFCALSTICVYELYGGDELWVPSAIKLGAWEHAPVVFMRDKIFDEPFDATGDQFAPLRVPYELGTPINRSMRDMKTPNKKKFVAEIRKALNGRNS